MPADFLFDPPDQPIVPVEGEARVFPVRRIFCVGRNYAAHAAEMGNEVDREAPFYFTKSALMTEASGATIAYPPGTENFHYEMELVIVIGSPVFRAERIRVPVLYSHGVNDPRVDIAETEVMVQALRENGEKLRRTIDEGAQKSEHLSAYVIETREKGEEIFGVADRIDDRLAKTRDTMTENIASLRTALALLDEEAGVVAETTATRVSEAVEQLEAAAEKARDALERYGSSEGRDLGGGFGTFDPGGFTPEIRRCLPQRSPRRLTHRAGRAGASSIVKTARPHPKR